MDIQQLHTCAGMLGELEMILFHFSENVEARPDMHAC